MGEETEEKWKKEKGFKIIQFTSASVKTLSFSSSPVAGFFFL